MDASRRCHQPALEQLFQRLFAKVVNEVKPDVIHAHAWSVFSSLARPAPRMTVMATAHETAWCARGSC